MTIVPDAPPRLVAHRGFSARQPEMTVAAYADAIEWSVRSGVALGLECDVQLTRDEELVCLHDQRLGRTCPASGLVRDRTLAQLRELDFGSWRVADPTAAQRSVVSLPDLLTLAGEARLRGADVTVVIETKHFQERTLQVEREVGRTLARWGWTGADAPVRLITFSAAGAALLARQLPGVEVALLLQHSLRRYRSGVLPEGVREAGVDVRLLRRDPGFVARAGARGNAVHAWTVNEPADVAFCRENGVRGYTTDDPERVSSVLHASGTRLDPVAA